MNYYQCIVDLGLYSSERRLKRHLNFLFKDIDFNNKNVLDVGGGIGIHSFFAAWMRAKEVICLDPEAPGCAEQLKNKFDNINKKLKLKNIHFIKDTFQNYNPFISFDVVILHNSINHLNDYASSRLDKDNFSKNEYKGYIKKLYKITNSQSKIIVCDCSNKNFFSLLGLKNPFDPTIEWEKHQSPKIWIDLFESCNFKKIKLKWSTFNRIGKIGNLILSNKIFSFFTRSHFCLYFEKI